MNKAEFIIELSKEGREWAKALHIPALLAFLTWHLPQPAWVAKVFGRKKPE